MTTTQAMAVITLASRLGDPSRPSLPPTKWHRFQTTLEDLGIDLASIFDEDFNASTIDGVQQDTATVVSELLQTSAAATIEASELEQQGIRVVTIVDGDYPESFLSRLGPSAPPILYVVGNKSLLKGDGVGIVGSRNASEAVKEAAESIAVFAASLGRTVVSGAARGVDTMAMNAAFFAGGTVVGIIADALRDRIRKPEVLSAIDDESICLLSQQHPATGFSPGSAMNRNKLIYALSQTTVVVAADLEAGGTWSGATEAIKKGYSDVAVWLGDGAGPGNAELVARGGRAIKSVDQLLDSDNTVEAEQLTLTELA